ncbi:MAG: translational GTPase TypA [Chlamydiae bacterium CG10_big_fil_rev_8_21_14_0_10_42_34]|nr:MAG: translational GTPase TypA [Chlamydiae bacterium CG10_big_fil_rev_8_21_14_0_10_42_34]
MQNPENIRNIAIIAHIDHGKTTLLDNLLKQGNIFREHEKVPERVMDSYDQEKERGITIFAKHTCVYYKDYKINIIDTPGHADFSGEVERVLGMVNCVLLLIDAQEGPMPQTRFVLSQALKMGLKPIVVLNKIDRPHANPDRALNLTFDLFMELGASDEQLDFPYIYASGFNGYAYDKIGDEPKDLMPLFEMILKKAPAPTGNLDLPFLMQAATLSYDDYVGRQACGRILEGKIRKNDTVTRVDRNGNHTNHKIVKIQGHLGLKEIEIEDAGAGDIVVLSGIPEVDIGDTLCSTDKVVQLPPITLAEPTVSVEFLVNTSPFVGKDGKHVTMNKLRERLMREKKANISLKIEELAGRDDAIRVCGRGELHLAVLIEAMRREGYEVAISKPKVITKEVDGVLMEPMERVHVEVPENFSGTVIDDLSRRKGEMRSLEVSEHGLTTMQFLVPTRGLMGYRNDFLTRTSGLGVLTSIFETFAPWKGDMAGRLRGVLISNSSGKANGYGLFNLQGRGSLFVKPGDDVYEGMIVGEHARDNDLVVNAIKAKQLTNVRASGSDENIVLTPPRKFTLEQAIDYIADDELVEVTPNFIRLRKLHLTEIDRKRHSR